MGENGSDVVYQSVVSLIDRPFAGAKRFLNISSTRTSTRPLIKRAGQLVRRSFLLGSPFSLLLLAATPRRPTVSFEYSTFAGCVHEFIGMKKQSTGSKKIGGKTLKFILRRVTNCLIRQYRFIFWGEKKSLLVRGVSLAIYGLVLLIPSRRVSAHKRFFTYKHCNASRGC